jgi:uncharacterized membrane protein YfcA
LENIHFTKIIHELETCAASLGIGLSLGFIGAGGSILTIPVFVYILKKDPLSSSVYSMFVVGIASMAGAIESIYNKMVDFRAMLMFGIPSIAGVLIARRLIFPSVPAELFSIGSFTLSKNILFMLCLALLMSLSAIRMLKGPVNKSEAAQVEQPAIPALVLRGLLVGILAGLLGVGGGFLIVPALYFLAGLPVKRAIGTALLIITFNALFGFFTSFQSINLEWPLLIKFSCGAVLGILIGTKLSSKMPGERVKKIFGYCVLCMSFYIVYKQFFI